MTLVGVGYFLMASILLSLVAVPWPEITHVGNLPLEELMLGRIEL